MVRVQAGVVTEQLQNYAEQQGMYYPVDFASTGSSQIGGNIGLEPVEGGDVFAIDNNNVVYGFWKDLEAIKEQLYGAKPDNTEKPTP